MSEKPAGDFMDYSIMSSGLQFNIYNLTISKIVSDGIVQTSTKMVNLP